jgi:hypothetical protein
MKKFLVLVPLFLALTGCDYLDLNGEVEAQKQIKNANAVGAGCKQAGKSIEECYQSNPKAIKSAVFDGWKTMDEYMRENNMQVQSVKEEEIVEPTKNSVDTASKTSETVPSENKANVSEVKPPDAKAKH